MGREFGTRPSAFVELDGVAGLSLDFLAYHVGAAKMEAEARKQRSRQRAKRGVRGRRF